MVSFRGAVSKGQPSTSLGGGGVAARHIFLLRVTFQLVNVLFEPGLDKQDGFEAEKAIYLDYGSC